jgi:hypothetical protein
MFNYDVQNLSNNIMTSITYLYLSLTQTHTPGEASPGAGQGTEDGSEGQSRKERVEGEVEQSLHPVRAQAFQRVNIILRNRDRKS